MSATPIIVGSTPSVNCASFFQIADRWDNMCLALMSVTEAEVEAGVPLSQARVFSARELAWGYGRLFSLQQTKRRRELPFATVADKFEVIPLHRAELLCYETVTDDELWEPKKIKRSTVL